MSLDCCMVQNLQENLEKLICAYETQKARANKAEAELEQCNRKLADISDKNKQLEEKIDNLSLRSVFTSSQTDNGQAKARIDRLIKEIDNALALLK